jgi:hypothetical protein
MPSLFNENMSDVLPQRSPNETRGGGACGGACGGASTGGVRAHRMRLLDRHAKGYRVTLYDVLESEKEAEEFELEFERQLGGGGVCDSREIRIDLEYDYVEHKIALWVKSGDYVKWKSAW